MSAIIVVAAGLAHAAAPAPLPPVSGEVSGEFTALEFPSAPTLHWTVSLGDAAGPGERQATFAITAPGTSLRGTAVLESWQRATWRLAEGRFELARWFPILAPFVDDSLSAVRVEGVALVAGQGTFREGDVAGRARFEVNDANIRDATAEWSVEGVQVRGTLAELPQLSTDGAVTLRFRAAEASGIVAHEGHIEFSVDFKRRIHVQRAAMNLMEGRVGFTPFVFDPAKPEVRTHANFERVELARFARFLPSVLADADGPVSGRVQISWSVAEGLRSASGTLRAEPGSAALIRLAPSPGFLTSRLPENMRERINLLPKWLGPIRKLFQPKNPAYTTLRAIEMGEARLEVTTLELAVDPEGDPQGRTARIVVLARPAAGASAVESVRFEINVTGPVADLLKLGLEGRVKVRAR